MDANCHQTYGSGGDIDYNGYHSDGPFAFYLVGYGPLSTYQPACSLPSSYRQAQFCSFADLRTYSPFEHHGQIVGGGVCGGTSSLFANCFVPPIDSATFVTPPPNMAPPPTSTGIGAAVGLPGLNDHDSPASGPSLGAIEPSCVASLYGPRPPGLTERNIYTCAGYQGFPYP